MEFKPSRHLWSSEFLGEAKFWTPRCYINKQTKNPSVGVQNPLASRNPELLNVGAKQTKSLGVDVAGMLWIWRRIEFRAFSIDFRRFQAISCDFQQFSLILADFQRFWTTCSDLGQFFNNFSRFSAILDDLQRFWAISGVLGTLLGSLGALLGRSWGALEAMLGLSCKKTRKKQKNFHSFNQFGKQNGDQNH